jgi:phage shock protein PspC (stress-responsive transcriptional regulator)
MKRFLDLLKSERPLIAGVLGSLSDHFGWDRAVVRVAGLFAIWGAPFCLGAHLRNAWWISILIYAGLALIARKISCASRPRGSCASRRWRERRDARSTDWNHRRPESETTFTTEASVEKGAPVVSSVHSPATGTGDEGNLVGEQFGEVLSDLEQRLARLDQRIQKMESAVTDRSFDWDRRLRRP